MEKTADEASFEHLGVDWHCSSRTWRRCRHSGRDESQRTIISRSVANDNRFNINHHNRTSSHPCDGAANDGACAGVRRTASDPGAANRAEHHNDKTAGCDDDDQYGALLRRRRRRTKLLGLEFWLRSY